MTNEQHKAIKILLEIADAVTEAVNTSKDGVPAGHLYAMMMQYLTLNQFNQLMQALVKTNKVKKQGLLYVKA